MASDIAAFPPSAVRLSVSAAGAESVRFGADGTERETSRHLLRADGWLHWDYTVRDERGDAHHSCDGTAIRSTLPGRGGTRHCPVPDPPTRDDPLYFCSWTAFARGWFAEMLRPVDLLARVRVTSTGDPDGEGRMRMAAEPTGSELSPYSGFSLTGRRRLELVLDTRRGCFTEVTVVHRDSAGADRSSFHRLTRPDP
ncbi:hypothetical protein FHX37_3095 [Haloactinospora alba]|uniref:Uncharacterized protein n=1 Tax=Haloactinospora alba TaxID=405555 RepID=A0A543NMP9_9ACTN|nr:hypothetical protein [Haloactinospora alba]TQN33096.1 hypothetical protein FHX37_3095 [Haloactinospora alba]